MNKKKFIAIFLTVVMTFGSAITLVASADNNGNAQRRMWVGQMLLASENGEERLVNVFWFANGAWSPDISALLGEMAQRLILERSDLEIGSHEFLEVLLAMVEPYICEEGGEADGRGDPINWCCPYMNIQTFRVPIYIINPVTGQSILVGYFWHNMCASCGAGLW